jgi:L-asparaginase
MASMSMQPSPTVVVLGTGGTIAGRGANGSTNVGYESAVVGIETLVAGVAPRDFALEVEQVAQLDSKDMDAATRWRLRSRVAYHTARAEVRAVVVTHGTDTLEETAFWLARTTTTPKPVILTGAMRPATSLQADGPQNLADAFVVATTPGAFGVVAVLAQTVHAARDVRKVHPYRLDAFSSGDPGPIGYVEAGRLRRLRDWPGPLADAATVAIVDPAAVPWPRVEIVWSQAGADGRIVRSLVNDGVAGIVVVATGNGEIHQALLDACQDARRRGVAALRCVRGDGVVVTPQAASSEEAIESAFDLTPAKARIEVLTRLLSTGNIGARGEGQPWAT